LDVGFLAELMKKLATYLIASTLIFVCVVHPADAQRKKKRKAQLNTVLVTAKSYVGTPYQWGGNTKRGIDCSGLIHNSYKAAGIKVPRNAKEQSKYGKSKGWNEIREGDVVTFKFKEKREKWWHAGIVTKVSSDQVRFVHASTSRGVIEDNLLSDYYKKNVKRIRRIIK
jgi:probable lipoprotein NlpC